MIKSEKPDLPNNMRAPAHLFVVIDFAAQDPRARVTAKLRQCNPTARIRKQAHSCAPDAQTCPFQSKDTETNLTAHLHLIWAFRSNFFVCSCQMPSSALLALVERRKSMRGVRNLGFAPAARSKLKGVTAALLASIVVAVGIPQASQASGQSPYVKKGSSHCIFIGSTDTVPSPTHVGGCGLVGSALRSDNGTYGGHPAIKIWWRLTYKVCLDSLGQKSGAARINWCNTGDYQVFEVFNGSAAGTKVLKSVGAYVHQGVHICLSSGFANGSAISWATCDTNSSLQQFNWNP